MHEKVKDRLLEKITPTFESWRVGDPLDEATKIGALIEERHLDKVLSYIEIGKKEGAKVALGGNRVLKETGGYFVEPTVFDGVSNGMQIAREEIFGPVLSVIEFAVPFGGFKASGFGGKDKSLMAHDQYTEVKTIWIQLR